MRLYCAVLQQVILSCTILYLRPQLSAQLDFAASSAGLLNILIYTLICLCMLYVYLSLIFCIYTRRWLACLFILGRPLKASECIRK